MASATRTAQKLLAQEKRALMRAVARQIADLSPEQRQAIVDQHGAVVTVEGRALSVHNTLMVLHQMPTASVVGGFRQWIAAGRCVRKGEHGAAIWVPTGQPESQDQDEEEGDSRPTFLMAWVFDVSQTEAAEAREAA